MIKEKLKIIALGAIVVLSGVFLLGSLVYALSGSFPIGIETCNNCSFKVDGTGNSDGVFGAAVASDATHLSQEPKPTAFGNTFFSGDIEVDGTAYFDGNISYSGQILGVRKITSVANTVTTISTTTLTVADSGETFVFSSVSSTVFVLPATTTASGVEYTFFVGGALTGDVTIVTNNGGNIIEGTLIVAGAVVDCASEDTITFVSDGENIGDFVTLISDGTHWLIRESGALTASKLTCTAT